MKIFTIITLVALAWLTLDEWEFTDFDKRMEGDAFDTTHASHWRYAPQPPKETPNV